MNTKHPLSVAVFCSAATDLASEYYEQTTLLGRWIGQQGWRLVYGGATLGLMDCVARAAKEAGATVTGVVPDKLVERGIVSDLLDENIPVRNLGERKAVMLRESDLFIALPGGLGTLDEVFHVVGESSIGYHTKPVILFNINGCWDSLLHMLDDLRRQGLLRHDLTGRLVVANTLEDIKNYINLQL
ncbi:MAG: TIGR00730 family Rossman fold protein [Bacteroidaceae bacterium]|nr:TIGR00730 family Rossman fold protein [Bacteroidaceae bacterium]